LFLAPLATLAAVVSMIVLPAPAASAAIYQFQGIACAGSKLIRCGWVNLDSTNNRVRAYARASDTTAGTVTVDVHACLQRLNPGGAAEMRNCGEYISDPEVAVAITDTEGCSNGREYRAYVFWVWDPPGAAVERGQWWSNWVRPNVC